MENTELYHHGTLGMKWGRRLYQNKDGSLTALGRKRYGTKANLTKAKRQATIEAKKKEAAKAEAKAAKVAKKTQAEEAKKVKTAEEEKADIAKKKEQILKSRSAKELYDNADLFTTQELRDAYSRLTLERDIKNLQPATVSKGKQFVDSLGILATGAKNVNTILKEGIGIGEDIKKIKKLFGNNKPNNNPPNNDKSGKDKSGKDEAGKDKPLSGTVTGEGTSHKTFTGKHSRKKSSSSNDTIWDVDFEDVTSSGKTFVNNLFGGSSSTSSTRRYDYDDSTPSISGGTKISGLLGSGSSSTSSNTSSNVNGSSEKVSKGKTFVSNLFKKTKQSSDVDYTSDAFKKSAKKDIDAEIRDFTNELMKTVSEGVETYRKTQEKNNK